MKTFTVYGSVQKRSKKEDFWKRRLFVYVWTDENGGFRIQWWGAYATTTPTARRTPKIIRVKLTKQQFFCTHVFLRRRCTTTTSQVPNFTFCRGREHKTTTFLFFSPTLIQSCRIQLQKKIGELNKNKGDKVRGSANSLFKWRFRSRRSRWCLSSLSHDACSVRDDIVFTLYVRVRMFLKMEKKKIFGRVQKYGSM